MDTGVPFFCIAPVGWMDGRVLCTMGERSWLLYSREPGGGTIVMKHERYSVLYFLEQSIFNPAAVVLRGPSVYRKVWAV